MNVIAQWALTALLGIAGRMLADYLGRKLAEWSKAKAPAVATQRSALRAVPPPSPEPSRELSDGGSAGDLEIPISVGNWTSDPDDRPDGDGGA